ncbi:MAG: hypothetical protein RLZ32_1873, partial [Gemmatimonadota bacterium]
YDLQVHPRDKELIAATHGRGFWIVDIAPLQEMTAAVAAKPAHLFTPKPAFQWGEGPTRGASGNGNAQGFFATQNPAYGAAISYRVTQAGQGPARISIVNAMGDTVASLTGPSSAGVHTVTWGYNVAAAPAPRAPLSPSEKRDSILRAVRAPKVLDSLAAARYDSVALATVRQLLAPPTGGMAAFGGRGGGGRGATGACERPMTQWEPFCARPAEAAVARGGGNAQAQELAARAQQMAAASGTPAVRKVFELIGLPAPAQGGRGGGFGGFGGGSIATTGDYGVVLQVGNTVLKSRLRVENVGGARSGTATAPEEDEGRR